MTYRRIPYALTGILVLGLLLRLYHINFQSLWLDELFSIVPADPRNSLPTILDYAKYDQPPLFFLLLHYIFVLFGYSEVVGRIACAGFGSLGILAIYFLAKECNGKATGLFAAFLTTFNYFHIYYSQELRFYSLAFLLSTLSYLFLIRAFKRTHWFDFAGYVFFTSCLLYTHYYGIIIFGSQFLTFFFLLWFKRDLRFILYSIGSGILIGVSFIPWIPTVIFDVGATTTTWIKRPGPFFLAEFFYDYTGKEIITTLILISFMVLFIKSLKTSLFLRPENMPVYWIILLWILLTYEVPYIRSVTGTPMLHPRYTIVTLPALILVFSLGWSEIKNTKWKYGSISLLVLGFCINMIFFKRHYTRVEKTQFREASEWVRANNTSHVPVYSERSWHFNFYFRNDDQKVRSLQGSDLSTTEAFWLLQAHDWVDFNAELEALKVNYKIAELHSFHEANAVLLRHK